MVDQLLVPRELPRLEIERNDAVGEQIVPGSHVAAELRVRVADTHVDQPQVQIDRWRHPDCPTAEPPGFALPGPALEPRFTWCRNRIEHPALFPGLRIQRDQTPPQVAVTTGYR